MHEHSLLESRLPWAAGGRARPEAGFSGVTVHEPAFCVKAAAGGGGAVGGRRGRDRGGTDGLEGRAGLARRGSGSGRREGRPDRRQRWGQCGAGDGHGRRRLHGGIRRPTGRPSDGPGPLPPISRRPGRLAGLRPGGNDPGRSTGPGPARRLPAPVRPGPWC